VATGKEGTGFHVTLPSTLPIRGAQWDAAAAAGRPGERGRPRPGEERRVQRRPALAGRGMQGPAKERKEGGERRRAKAGGAWPTATETKGGA